MQIRLFTAEGGEFETIELNQLLTFQAGYHWFSITLLAEVSSSSQISRQEEEKRKTPFSSSSRLI